MRSLFIFLTCCFFPLHTVDAVEVEKFSGSTVYHSQNFVKERSGASVIINDNSLIRVRLQNDTKLPTFEVNCAKDHQNITLTISKGSIKQQLNGKTMSAEVNYGGRAFKIKVFGTITDTGNSELILDNKIDQSATLNSTIEAFKTLYAIADKGMGGEMQIKLNNKTSIINLTGMSNVSNIYESKCENYQSH